MPKYARQHVLGDTMATIQKRGNAYRVQVIRKIGQNRICKSATFDTIAEARAWGIEKEAELLRLKRGQHPDFVNNDGKITLHKAINIYKEKRVPAKLGARWESIRCEKLKRELPFIGKLIDAVTPSDISEWCEACLKTGLKSSSVNREITLLSAIFEFARKEKRWIGTNPISYIKRPPESKPRFRLISPEERQKILDALDYAYGKQPTTRMHYIALAFLFAIETGARAGEIRKLRWEFVNYERKVARVTGGTKNGDYWRDLPLSSEAVNILKLCENGSLAGEMCFPLSAGYMDTMFRRARDKCGIKDLHFHDTRHQAATNLAGKLTPYQLTRTLGHRTLEHVMVYYNEDAADIAKKL